MGFNQADWQGFAIKEAYFVTKIESEQMKDLTPLRTEGRKMGIGKFVA